MSSCHSAAIVFLVVVLFVPAAVAAQQSSGAERAKAIEQGRAFAEAKQYDEALAIFRRLAKDNPEDYEARNWVARLTSWQGDFERAERLYRAVLEDDPGNFVAELGLVDVLSWQGRYQAAEERLVGLEADRPDNLAVLLRRGRLARWQRQRDEALDAYERVLAVDPDNEEALEAVAALEAETRYQLEAGYFFEAFDFAGETNGQFVELLYHDLDRLWLLGRFSFQNKFNENNTRYTLGGTYRFFSRTYLRGEVSLAPSGDTVIANQDYTIEVTQGLHPTLSAGGGYRFLNFREADVHVLTALVNWHPRSDLHLYVRYVPSRSSFDGTGQGVWNQNGWGRLVWDAHRTVSPFLLFAVGSETFIGLTADELGAFAAQTYGVGAEVRLTPVQGFRAGYHYQNRSRGRREQGFNFSYFYRF